MQPIWGDSTARTPGSADPSLHPHRRAESRRRANPRSHRTARRGTVLIVVLGLLVVLALIGIAFSFIVIAEYRSSQSALDRFRALSAARDGEAYAIAALREYAVHSHYEAEAGWTWNTDVSDKQGKRTRLNPGGRAEAYSEYLKRCAKNSRLLGANPDIRVSFAKSGTTTTTSDPDNNWIDLNGDGRKSDEETNLARDLMESAAARGIAKDRTFANVSYFTGDAIPMKLQKTAQQGGTYRELGDRSRLKVIDTNAQFCINDYKGEQLIYMLMVLGREIHHVLGDNPGQNPFGDKKNVTDLALYKERHAERIQSKDDIIPFLPGSLTAESREYTLDQICVKTWPLPDSGITGTKPDYAASRYPDLTRPLRPTERAAWDKAKQADETEGKGAKLPWRNVLGKGMPARAQDREDGCAEVEPTGGRVARAPININTVSLPVLTAMLAGLEAEPTWFYFPALSTLLRDDEFTKEIDPNSTLKAQYAAAASTDFGRQPNDPAVGLSTSADAPNNSIFQVIPVGPLGYELTPSWKEGSDTGYFNPWYGGSHASNLAKRILDDREKEGPYQSWQDFDYRVCHEILSAMEGAGANMRKSPDLVNVGRSDRSGTINMNLMPKGNQRNDHDLFPNPQDVRHPANPAVNNGTTAYKTAEFEAWYWRACVDMIRANFNPNGYYAKRNPDDTINVKCDSQDMKYTTAPMCFSTMGVYEVVSQGEITAVRFGSKVSRTGGGQRGDLSLEYPVARRTFRSIVEVYRILEHTTQTDFTKTYDKNAWVRQAQATGGASGTTTAIANPVQLTFPGTASYPASMDMSLFETAKDVASKIHRTGTPTDVTGRDGDKNHSDPCVDGYYSTAAADTNFGWISLRPLDRTPLLATRSNESGLNFHAQYNYSLEAVPHGQGGLSANSGNAKNIGHVPYSLKAGPGAANTGADPVLSRTWNSATPDPYRTNWPDAKWKGFVEGAARTANESAKNATLRPDGALLRGWSYNPSFRRLSTTTESSIAGITGHYTFEAQDTWMSRLTLLRYRCGQNSPEDVPFAPIFSKNPDPSKELISGPASPNAANPFGDPPYSAAIRATGLAAQNVGTTQMGGNQGTDGANKALEGDRQQRTNFPYYQGWVDFWIKWELPAQGEPGKPICAGEVDPGSANFSGLIGACSYGRFEETLNTGGSAAPGFGVRRDQLGNNNDFEGSEFFVFKEPGGIIRVSHIYFNAARTIAGAAWDFKNGAWAATPTGAYTRMGSNSNRILGATSAAAPDGNGRIYTPDRYYCTNDCCPEDPAGGDDDLGFSLARNESFFDMNSGEGADEVDLVPHHWYRFSLLYRSNMIKGVTPVANRPPHQLFINGTEIKRSGPAIPDASTGAALFDTMNRKGFNSGAVTNDAGIQVAADFGSTPGATPAPFFIQRSATWISEIDPEDRLTIGCILRNQTSTSVTSAPGTASAKSLFRFEQNLVAPANATLDDVRIYWQIRDTEPGTYSPGEFAQYSRFKRSSTPVSGGELDERCMYENGFVAIQTTGGVSVPFTFPIKVGSISWTEYRPSWDSYRRERLDADEATWSTAPQVLMGFQTYTDISQMLPDGSRAEVLPQNFTSTNRQEKNYWLAGGYALETIQDVPKGVYINNDFTNPERPAIGFFKYQAHFITPSNDKIPVQNSSAVLDDVRITLLTPPRRLSSEEIFQ